MKNGLMPIPPILPPAQQSLLEQISCKCTKVNSATCYRRLGIKCFIFCEENTGINCETPNNSDISEEDRIQNVDADFDTALVVVVSINQYHNHFMFNIKLILVY